MAIAIGSAHAATNLVTNGDFSSGPASNTQFGAGFGGQTVTGWTGGATHPATDLQFYFVGGTQSTVSATNQYGDPNAAFYPTFNTLSPNSGGNFVGLDGDSQAQGEISQTLSGLIVGKTYTLTFDWAAAQLRNRTGATTEQLAVSFGGQTFNTGVLNVASGGFSGWNTVTMFFTPTATTQTLSFLSIGTPVGLPPIAALDSVVLTVPEPATWAMMLVGFGGIGAMIRRRRHTLVAA